MLSRRKFLFAGSLGAAGIATQSCGILKGRSGRQSFYFFPSPQVPTVITTTTDGTSVTLSGIKTSSGQVSRITRASVIGRAEDITLISYNERGQPTSINSRQDGALEINYISESRILINFRSPDGKDAIQFPLDLRPDSDTETQGREALPTRSGPAPDVSTFSYRPGQQAVRQRFSPSQANGQIRVSCDAAGEIPLPDVEVTVVQTFVPPAPTIPPKYITIPSEEIATGQFLYRTDETFDPTVEEARKIAASIIDVIDALCSIEDLINPKKEEVAEQVSKNIPRISKAQVLRILGKFNLACRVYNVGEITLAVMDAFTSEVVGTTKRSITAYAQHPTLGWVGGESSEYDSVTGPLPEFLLTYLDSPNAARLNEIIVGPEDPDPNEGYVFATETICASSGWQVRLNISGTDGYTNSTTVTIGDDAFTIAPLAVPGAEAGVKDTLTAELMDQNGQRIGSVQTKQIVF